MKIKDIVTAFCLVALGIAIGFYLARNVWPPAKMVVMRFNAVGDMSVGAGKGDQLEWYNGTDPVPVKFKPPFNPCTNSSDPDYGTCTMKDSGLYLFNCVAPNVCTDPQVGGGDETFQRGKAVKAAVYLPPPYATPKAVNVYCDPSTSTAMADVVVKGQQGQAFTIQLEGTGTDFTATFPAGTCDPGDSLSKASPNCRIKPAVTADTNYPYQIALTGITCTNGTATLTELKP